MQIDHLFKYLAVFGVSYVIVFIFTPLFIKITPKFGLIDYPDSRCVHSKPTPLAGGVVVFLGFHVACFTLYQYFWKEFSGQLNFDWWYAFFLASSFLLGIGLVDDRFNTSPILKLVGQSSAALILYFLSDYQVNLLNLDFDFLWGMLFVLIWNLTIINAFNLIDGLDGLCSGLALISGIGLTTIFIFRGFPGDALVCIALIGSCLGFLRYNFFPAKIFLGDTGSMFLGFAIANISLQAGGKGSVSLIIAALFFVAGVPVLDTLLAMWRRSIRKLLAKNNSDATPVKIMGADREHLHHRLLNSGATHKQVAYILYAVNIVIIALGIIYFIYKDLAIGLFLIALIISIYLLFRYILKIELWETSRLIAEGFSNSKYTDFNLALYLLFDVAWMSVMVWLSGFLVLNGEQPFSSLGKWANSLPLWIVPTFILMFASNTYIKIWRNSSFKDFLLLSLAIIIGALFSLAIFFSLNSNLNFLATINQACLFILFTLLGILGIRIPFHLSREWIIGNHSPIINAIPRSNILLYGSGQVAGLYLRAHYLNHENHHENDFIIGFIDDNPSIKGKYTYGLPILGGVAELEKVAQEKNINGIILTIPLSDESLGLLKKLCLKLNITLFKWKTTIIQL